MKIGQVTVTPGRMIDGRFVRENPGRYAGQAPFVKEAEDRAKQYRSEIKDAESKLTKLRKQKAKSKSVSARAKLDDKIARLIHEFYWLKDAALRADKESRDIRDIIFKHTVQTRRNHNCRNSKAVAKRQTGYLLLESTTSPLKKVQVQDAEQASRILSAYRDRNGYGQSDFTRRTGQLVDSRGTVIGRVSYNGRVWDTADRLLWEPGIKTAKNVTDRAKRYRAKGNVAPQKNCFACGAPRTNGKSRTGLDVHHILGDESDDRRQNLTKACRACNTKIANVMRKAGLGTKTRQFNPKDYDKVAKKIRESIERKAEKGWTAEQIAEKIWLVYGRPTEARGNTLRVWFFAPGKSLNDLTPAEEFQIGAPNPRGVKKRARSHAAPSLGAYLSALAIMKGEQPGNVSQAVKLVHDTDPAQRSAFASRIWQIRRERYGPTGRQESLPF